MSAKFVFKGLDELKRELRNLPEELTGDASDIIQRAVTGAAETVKGIYRRHRKVGNLEGGVYVSKFNKGRFAAGAVLKSRAPHAWLFDNGSQARHHASGKSTGAMWGKTAPTHAFVGTAIRARRKMYQELAELVTRKGLKVTGTP